jgi:hypothetical protein
VSTDPDSPVVDDGIVAEFAAEEYLYGIGVLRVRIIRVTLVRSNPQWALVDGIHIDHRGDAHERRAVMVTIAALRRYGLARS